MYASVNLISIGSGEGLSPIRLFALLWLNSPLQTNFSEIRIEIEKFNS